MGGLNIYKEQLSEYTTISNYFIDHYMEDANEAQLQVYLYLLRMISDNLPVSVADIVTKFRHSEKEVLRALKYWELQQLLSLEFDSEKNLTGIRFHSLPTAQSPKTQVATVTPISVKLSAPADAEKPAAAPEAKVEPAPVEAAPVKEAEPVKETAPVATEPAKQPTMAEKAAQATTAPAAGPQDESLKQGLEAYEKGDYKLAHDLFKRAAIAGNAEACYQLGLMLSTGKGSVAKNPLQGKVWIKKAAGLGHAEAAKALETN